MAPIAALRLLTLLRIVQLFKLKEYQQVMLSTFREEYHLDSSKVGPYLLYLQYFRWSFIKQVKAVVSIIGFMIAFQYLTLGTLVNKLGSILGGMVATIVGLFFFLEGLTFGLMPLGTALGLEAPKKFPMWGVFIVAFFLGILGKQF